MNYSCALQKHICYLRQCIRLTTFNTSAQPWCRCGGDCLQKRTLLPGRISWFTRSTRSPVVRLSFVSLTRGVVWQEIVPAPWCVYAHSQLCCLLLYKYLVVGVRSMEDVYAIARIIQRIKTQCYVFITQTFADDSDSSNYDTTTCCRRKISEAAV